MARPRIVVVGAGFGGFSCLRGLERRLPRGAAELVLVNPSDYHLYTPLLPQVAAGVVNPVDVAVPLRALRRTRLRPGEATGVDLDARTVTVCDRDGDVTTIGWDRLVLAPGSVTRAFPVPGLKEHAHGFKTITEAVHLRERVLAQLELADGLAEGPERASYTTFVVVGAGLAGTEYVAQMRMFVRSALAAYPRLRAEHIRWIIVDPGRSILSHLDPRLSERALAILRARDVDARLGAAVDRLTADTVHLNDGTTVACRLLVWTAGVAAAPLVGELGLPTEKGRLVVGADLAVPGRPDVVALGDAAAVPDLTRPGSVCPQTAQHAMRQGQAAARNVAAGLGYGRARPYRHRDLGSVADLGGGQAVAAPFNLRVTGPAAAAITGAYHLFALPATGNRLRVVTDWALTGLLSRQTVGLGLVPDAAAELDRAEQLSIRPPAG
ncbi:NAD(P)/FAD-dependent oxidoreductase [Nonomuraea longispora]|uniref:NAD(P)/FAD-dependent oxidoreductase n=2 Tax=Nonomuraea longispora TaxID=1848320 RepID=A0A4R4MS46_9ACTN|nr:NAD(P)/FAD-dependent oxidoreductase [Nonomuraea longispora]